MGILLNDEEIEALSVWWLDAPEAVDWAETLNRAQVKKVVEWLEFNSFEETCATAPANCYKRYRIMTIGDWQALRKEAGL